MKYLKRNIFVLVCIYSILNTLFFPLYSANPEENIVWGDSMGWIHVFPDTGNVQVNNGKLTGNMWSTQYGWISLQPSSSGITFEDKIVDDKCNSILQGYAWSSHLGWINFDGVFIDNNGFFYGRAAGPLSGNIAFKGNGFSVDSGYIPQCDYPETPKQAIKTTVDESVVLEESKSIISQSDIQNKLYTLENNFSSCDVVGDMNNQDYVYATSGIFTDEDDIFYTTPVMKSYSVGMIDGYDDNSFRPNQSITRAEFLKILLGGHCHDYSQAQPGEYIYVDIAPNSWQSNVAHKAEELGIASGETLFGGETMRIFRPNDTISKIEALKMILNMSGIIVEKPEPVEYIDIHTSWHTNYVQTAQSMGLLDPRIDNYMLYPNDGISREYALYLIYTMMQKY